MLHFSPAIDTNICRHCGLAILLYDDQKWVHKASADSLEAVGCRAASYDPEAQNKGIRSSAWDDTIPKWKKATPPKASSKKKCTEEVVADLLAIRDDLRDNRGK